MICTEIKQVSECTISPLIVDFWVGMYSSIHKNLLKKKKLLKKNAQSWNQYGWDDIMGNFTKFI